MAAEEGWQRVVTLVSGFSALIFNVLLGSVILTTKCTYIGKYKWLLFLYTFSAVIYASCQLLVAANFFLLTDAYIFYDSQRILPIFLGNSVIAIYISSYGQNVGVLTLSFIYRYLAVCNPDGLNHFLRNWKIIGFLSALIIFGDTGAIVYAMSPAAFVNQIFEEPFFNATGFHIAETAHLGAMFYISGQLNLELFLSLAVFFLLCFAAGTVMTVLAIRIGKCLKNYTAESSTLAQNQKKIFTLLIFQLSFPILFNVIPVQIVLFSGYFRIHSERIVGYLGCVLTFAQVLDPLLIFYFIKPYHMQLVSQFSKIGSNSVGASHTGATAPITSTNNRYVAPSPE